MSLNRKWLLATVLAILAALFVASTGFAHANQLRSDPADGSVLDRPPEEIFIWFDEPISDRFNSVQLFDVDGQLIEITGIRRDPSDPALLVISVPELSPGVYSVLWKILSEVDGHYSQGLLVFGVGAGADFGTAVAAPVAGASPAVPEVVLRWLNLLMLSGLIGGIAMIQLVTRPAEMEARRSARPLSVFEIITRRVLAFAAWCAVGGIVVGLGFLLWQAVTLKEGLPEAVTVLNAAWEALFLKRWGTIWLIRQLALLCAGTCFFYIKQKDEQGKSDQTVWYLLGSLALLLIVLQTLSSHAAGLITDSTALAIVSDGLHLLGACLWMGGLLCLAIILLPLIRSHREEVGYLVQLGWRPFGRVAGVSIGILIATGLYNTSQQVASLDALLTTLYGQALLLKLGLLLSIGYFGFFHTGLLHPGLSEQIRKLFHGKVGWTPLELRGLPRLVLIKGSLSLALLLVTGLITASPSPRGQTYTVDPEEVPGALSQTVGDLVVTLGAKPNRPGQNVFTVFAASTRRPPPVEIARVLMRFNYLDQDIGRQSVTLEEVEPGRFMLGGNYLRLAGNWQIDVVVRRQGMADTVAHFNWVVALPGEAHPVIVSKAPLSGILALSAAALLLCIPLHALAVYRARKRKAIRESAGREKKRIYVEKQEALEAGPPLAVTVEDGS